MKAVLEDPKRLVVEDSDFCSSERAVLDIGTGELVQQVLLLVWSGFDCAWVVRSGNPGEGRPPGCHRMQESGYQSF